MIMIVKTPGSQMGSPAAAEEGGEEMGGEKLRVEREVKCKRDRRWHRRYQKPDQGREKL